MNNSEQTPQSCQTDVIVWRSFMSETPDLERKIKIKYKDDEIAEMVWKGFINTHEMMFAIVGWSYA